jgi:hypothetical protein
MEQEHVYVATKNKPSPGRPLVLDDPHYFDSILLIA